MPPREPELYKDKVEVSLDGRQIFYLFFGGAVIVGIVFVLGVLVGRRVEARGHLDRAKTQAATDPLAALDRLEGNGQLSFRASLTAGKDQPTEVEQEIQRRAAAKPETAKAEAPKAEKAAKSDSTKADKLAKSDDPPKADKPAKSDEAPKADKPAKSDDAPRSHYTLQLSSFQDRGEADAFLSSVKAQGFSARITQAEVDGKGTFYRVRMGTYASLDSANEARSQVEKALSKSASIIKL
jgi:septal ring-binding cell division protein DamX